MIKRNVTINFCGSLYNIDEDALQLLQQYTDTIRRHFSKIKGAEDVTDDIESRIAELFDEKIANGAKAITIEITQDVINRIGNLEDIAPDDNADDNDNSSFAESVKKTAKNTLHSLVSSKRFYRDTTNKKLSGVFAGLAQFFGGSAFAWRLCFTLPVIIIALSGSQWFPPIFFGFLLTYLLITIIAPKAEAPEDVLLMKGKSVTPQNIANEVTRQQKLQRSTFSEVMSVMGKIGIICLGIVSTTCLIAACVFFVTVLTHPIDGLLDTLSLSHLTVLKVARTQFLIGFGAAIAALAIIVYCCFHSISSTFGKTSTMGFKQRLTWLVAFILCLVLSISCFVYTAAITKPIIQTELRTQLDKIGELKTLVHDDFIYNNTDWDYFYSNGMRMKKAQNINGLRFTLTGQHYSGDKHARYFDACSIDHDLIYHAECSVDTIAGTYSLACKSREQNDSYGAYMFAVVSKDSVEISRHMTPFVADGDAGLRLFSDDEFSLPDNLKATTPGHDANNGKGYGWAYITINDIVVSQGATLTYGITTDPEFTGMESHVKWFSACDIELQRTL